MKINNIALLLLLLTAVVFTSCQTTTEVPVAFVQEESEVSEIERINEITIDSISRRTYPEEDRFVIAAHSPRLQFDEDEVRYALANAARQIAVYKGARVKFAKVIDENIIGTVHDQKVEIIYDQSLAMSYLDKLSVEQESRDTDYYAALVTMESESPNGYPEIAIPDEGKPGWINIPPDYPGYIIGVGVSGRRKTPYESWEQADKLAMAEIANFVETKVYAGAATIERAGESSKASTGVIKTLTWSDVNLKGLYILSRWREPDGSYYYSLAIAENTGD